MTFGVALKAARRQAGLKQFQLAELVGASQSNVSHLELDRRGVEQSPGIVARLEAALKLPAGELAKHLPQSHPARLMAAVPSGIDLPVMGVVAAGPGRHDEAEADERLRTSEIWAGCVVYRVHGDSMATDGLRHGDYLIVRQKPGRELRIGETVVAWIDAQTGHVVKRLEKGRWLRSGDGWERRLTDGDTIYGVLVGVVRITPTK